MYGKTLNIMDANIKGFTVYIIIMYNDYDVLYIMYIIIIIIMYKLYNIPGTTQNKNKI